MECSDGVTCKLNWDNQKWWIYNILVALWFSKNVLVKTEALKILNVAFSFVLKRQ